MKKKLVLVLLTMAFVCVLCGGNAMAAETKASEILSYYLVTIERGSSAGEIKVNYDVRADLSGTIGVESIEIYKSNGSYVTTITGTTSNGLLKSGSKKHSGTYTYTGTAGVSYYAVVTVSAKAGTVYDSDEITTGTAKAP